MRKTEELITSLATDLEPVRPLRAPTRRCAIWLVAGGGYLALLAFIVAGFRFQPGSADVGYALAQLSAVAAAGLSALAAFESVVPGRPQRSLPWAALALAVWLGVLILSAVGVLQDFEGIPARQEWACVAMILLGGSPLLAALMLMLRRGAPLRPRLTAVIAALAVGVLANVAACLAQPHSADMRTLIWHVGAVAALAVLCFAGARFMLPWASRRRAAQAP